MPTTRMMTLNQCQNLRLFPSAKCPLKDLPGGKDSWNHLTMTMKNLKAWRIPSLWVEVKLLTRVQSHASCVNSKSLSLSPRSTWVNVKWWIMLERILMNKGALKSTPQSRKLRMKAKPLKVRIAIVTNLKKVVFFRVEGMGLPKRSTPQISLGTRTCQVAWVQKNPLVTNKKLTWSRALWSKMNLVLQRVSLWIGEGLLGEIWLD